MKVEEAREETSGYVSGCQGQSDLESAGNLTAANGYEHCRLQKAFTKHLLCARPGARTRRDGDEHSQDLITSPHKNTSVVVQPRQDQEYPRDEWRRRVRRQTDRHTHTHTEGCVEEVAFFF